VQIILVHPRFKTPKALNITRKWVIGFAAFLLFFTLTSSGVISYVALRNAVLLKLPFAQDWVQQNSAKQTADRDEFVRQNIDALAVKVGHLQAKLTRLDAIGDRVATMAGIKPQDLKGLDSAPVLRPNFFALGGKGGAEPPSAKGMSLQELNSVLDTLANGLNNRGDTLAFIETEMLYRAAGTRLVPSYEPLPDGSMGSRFGYRTDPFTGRATMHEGIDFNAPVGTAIFAAGGGTVVFAESHPSYGNQIDVDHGDGVMTRYAHASVLLVKQGDIVKQGQKIAEVGSTGRSTGAHLHFEVRMNGESKDPLAYLQNGVLNKSHLASISKQR
jgi:murein DD-endopeptidase MepM/ murein hydrolase activator NlpD